MNLRKYAAPVEASNKEYAFEVCTLCKAQAHALRFSVQVSAANLRFGDGATREVGMDFKNMGAKKVRRIWPCCACGLMISVQVGVFTDPNLIKLYPVKTVSVCVSYTT